MSLNTAELAEAILAICKREQTEETDANASAQRFANGLANAIETFVKSGDVKVNVATTGSATAQTGTGTGKIT